MRLEGRDETGTETRSGARLRALPPRARARPPGALPLAFLLALLLVPGWGLVPAAPLLGQSTGTGALAGWISGSDGLPLDGVELTLVRASDGAERSLTGSRDGAFRFAFIPPGDYLLVAERFGYVPVRVSTIPVRAGESETLRLTLRASPPPVTETDRRSFAEVRAGGRAGVGSAWSRAAVQGLPLAAPSLGGVFEVAQPAAGHRGSPELPGRFTTAFIDGTHVEGIHHPRRTVRSAPFELFPTFFLQEVLPGTDDLDAERAPGPGTVLRATTVHGTNEPSLEVRASGALLPLGAEARLGSAPSATLAPGAAALFRGPLLPDTLHLAAGFEFRRMSLPLAQAAFSDPELGAAGLAILAPGSETGGERLGHTELRAWDLMQGFGRLDWAVGARSRIDLRAHIGVIRSADDAEGLAVLPPAFDEGTDLLLAAGLLTPFGDRSAFEMRASLERSARELVSGAAASWSPAAGAFLGSDPLGPSELSNRTVRLDPTFHLGTERHRLRIGGVLALSSWEETGPGGTPIHARVLLGPQFDDVLTLRREGPPSRATASTALLGLFVQDRWTPADGVTLTLGARVDGEVLPWDDLEASDLWRQRTGIEEPAERESGARFSPRVGVRWQPSPGSGWEVSAGGAIRHGRIHPGLFAEALADTGQVSVIRRLSPGSGGATLESAGRNLSILGPELRAPRTQSVSAGLAGMLGPRVGLELSGAVRVTDFLLRRRDLNEVPGALGVDPFGRPIRGELAEGIGGGAIVPGSDRRFDGFDVVWALESDGWARWWGVTAGLTFEGEADPSTGRAHARGELAYTFSESRDNGAVSRWAEAPPLPGRTGTDGREAAWVEGTSELDRPHDLAASGELLLLPGLDLRLGATLRVRSGTAFTPVVRDGFGGSDPLGWDRGVPIERLPSGTDSQARELARSFGCLASLERAAEVRNACRTEAERWLNARVSLAPASVGGAELRLVFDALNLLDTGTLLPDPALFVSDGEGTASVGDEGTVLLPVRTNPGFGRSFLDASPGRALRIGLEVRF